MIPQLIYLSLVLLGLGVALAEHGTQKTVKKNFYTDFIGAAFGLWLLYAGGFFNVFFK